MFTSSAYHEKSKKNIDKYINIKLFGFTATIQGPNNIVAR